MLEVVNYAISELSQQLLDQSIKLHVSDKSRSWLVENGLDPELGARPLERLVTDQLKKPLADYILFKHKGGASINVSLNEKQNKLALEYLKEGVK